MPIVSLQRGIDMDGKRVAAMTVWHRVTAPHGRALHIDGSYIRPRRLASIARWIVGKRPVWAMPYPITITLEWRASSIAASRKLPKR
jgi:hypothetical protein